MYPENYEDNVRIITNSTILRQPLWTWWWTCLQELFYACAHPRACVSLCLATNDRQPEWRGCKGDSSSFLSPVEVWVGVQDWQGSPWCQLSRLVLSHHCIVCGLHLMVQRTAFATQKAEEGRNKREKESLREMPKEYIIFLLISHWPELSYMAIPSCRGRWKM